MKISLGTFNPNEIKKNPVQEYVKGLHIRASRTKSKKDKLAQLERKNKQKGWD